MRTTDWFGKLSSICKAYSNAQWSRGGMDCGTFASDCLAAIGATGYGDELRGKYGTRVELLKMLSSLGYRDPAGYTASWCEKRGYPEIDPRMAQAGDLGLTSAGIVCIRMPSGYLAMGESGGLCLVNPCKAWAIEWA